MARKKSKGPYTAPTAAPKAPNWLDRLESHGRQVTKARRELEIAARPKPQVQETFITIRGASEHDPGEIAIAYFVVEDGLVTLTDQNGSPLSGSEPRRLDGEDAARVAARLLRNRRTEDRDDFTTRQVNFPSTGWR